MAYEGGEDGQSTGQKRDKEDERGLIAGHPAMYRMRILRPFLSSLFWLANGLSHGKDAIPPLCD
jgi:hypothetical protein